MVSIGILLILAPFPGAGWFWSGMVVSLSGKRGVLFRKRNVSPSGDCAHSGRGFFPFQETGNAPPLGRGGDFFLSENGMRPPFLFLPAGEKETRICALRAALRAVALRNAAAAAGARGWGCTPISFVEMHPPLLFLRVRRKRRVPCSVEKKKRGFG